MQGTESKNNPLTYQIDQYELNTGTESNSIDNGHVEVVEPIYLGEETKSHQGDDVKSDSAHQIFSPTSSSRHEKIRGHRRVHSLEMNQLTDLRDEGRGKSLSFTTEERYKEHSLFWQKVEPNLDLKPILNIPALHNFTTLNYFKIREG